jgi:hypothetical protein
MLQKHKYPRVHVHARYTLPRLLPSDLHEQEYVEETTPAIRLAAPVPADVSQTRPAKRPRIWDDVDFIDL